MHTRLRSLPTRRPVFRTFALTVALVAAGCAGSDEASDASAAELSSETTEAVDEMEGMRDGAMNMGDPSATPADEVADAALARGDFTLLDTRPVGFDDAAGTAWIARHGGGTTVTVELRGLEPEVDYISHVHADSCANDNGGDHYQFDIGGSELPPNEIHLAFTADADGNGFMTAENDQIAGLDAVALVVHPAELIDNKIACVDFVEEEPGAAAAALAAGLDVDRDS